MFQSTVFNLNTESFYNLQNSWDDRKFNTHNALYSYFLDGF
jgi:hypothetical protein